MRDAVAGLTDDEIRAAADYFAQQSAKTFLRVVEQAKVPATPKPVSYSSGPAMAPSRVGKTIVEMPDDYARFEARDPHVTYTAYVHLGKGGRGRALAEDDKRTPRKRQLPWRGPGRR